MLQQLKVAVKPGIFLFLIRPEYIAIWKGKNLIQTVWAPPACLFNSGEVLTNNLEELQNIGNRSLYQIRYHEE